MADSVEIVLGANVSKAVQGLTQFANTAKLAVGAAVTALEELVRRSIDFGDEIGKAAQRAGVAVEQFSALAYSGKLADVQVDSLVTGFRGLSKSVAENNKAFDELGIAILNKDGTFRDVDAIMMDVADVFERLPDGVRKTTLATDIFGRSGQNLIPLLNQGSRALREQKLEAKDLGVVIDQDFANAAQEFNDNLTRVREAVKGLGLDMAKTVLPELQQLILEILNLAKAIRKLEEETASKPGFFTALGASAIQVGSAGAQAIASMFTSKNIAEFKSRIQDIGEEGRNVIKQLWNPDFSADGEPNAPWDKENKSLKDNIAYLSEEDRIRHRLFVIEQLFADSTKDNLLSERERSELEKVYLQQRFDMMQKLTAEIEKHRVPGGFGVAGDDDPSKLSEVAKAYNEKLLPATRELMRIQERIAQIDSENSFTGRLSKQLGKAAESAFNLSARLADTFSSAIMTGIDGIAAGITGLIDGTRSWGETMQQIGSQILGMFVQLIVRAVALYAIISLLNLVSPGLGSAIGKFAGVGGKAEGGPVGPGFYTVGEQGSEYVVNNPTLARFGTGFFDQLQRGGSVPAPSGGGGGGANVHVALLNEQHQYHNWLQSTAGEKVVVDIVSRNIHRFRS